MTQLPTGRPVTFHDPSGLPVLFVIYDRGRWSITDSAPWVVSLLLVDAARAALRPVCSCGWTVEGTGGEYGWEVAERLDLQLQPTLPVHEPCGDRLCGCRANELAAVVRAHGGQHGSTELELAIPLS